MYKEDNNKEVNLAFDIYDHCHSASPSLYQPSFLYPLSCPIALFQSSVRAWAHAVCLSVSLIPFCCSDPGKRVALLRAFLAFNKERRVDTPTHDRPWHCSVPDRDMHPFMCSQAGASRIEGSGSIIYMARRIHRVPKVMRRISI